VASEQIFILATLEYIGDEDTVTIWHGDPYILFSISDGKDFNSDGIFAASSGSIVLSKAETYRFDYQKSGGWGADDPNAGFWEKIYS
jgi:hypothetical protein